MNTKNFKFAELWRSATAENLGIDNEPKAPEIIARLAVVQQRLQAIRSAFGAPITINSGYRCEQLNKAVGGASTSQHLRGEAVDITSTDNKRLYDVIRDLFAYDQLIKEHPNSVGVPRWIHVSFLVDESKQRNQTLTIK